MSKSEEKILLALRKSNGQIGYLSEGITIPEFYELIQPKENNINILVDFSPIINTLYNLHNQQRNEKIDIDYNSLYHYFLDIQTYRDKKNKLEIILDKSNDFISLIKTEFKNTIENNRYENDTYKKLNFIKRLEHLSNLYIDALLIFIYSKANIDIKSFKNDIVLTKYIHNIKEEIYKLYESHIEVNRGIINSNFILYLLFEDEKNLSKYLNIIENITEEKKDIKKIKLEIFDNSYKDNTYNYHNEPIKRVYSEYYIYNSQYIQIAEILMNILYKINSVSMLVEQLKNQEVEFKSGEKIVKEIKQLIKKTTT